MESRKALPDAQLCGWRCPLDKPEVEERERQKGAQRLKDRRLGDPEEPQREHGELCPAMRRKEVQRRIGQRDTTAKPKLNKLWKNTHECRQTCIVHIPKAAKIEHLQ
eukprot:Amastigsp_a3618_15.p6 type:complete len:107 gc:universal Amastigsp_a3618_15:698-378(-)